MGGVLIRGSLCGGGPHHHPPSHLPKSTPHPIGSMGQSWSIGQIWGWGSFGVPGGVPIWGGDPDMGVPICGGGPHYQPPSHLPKSTLHRIESMGQSSSIGQIWGAGWGSFGVCGGVPIWGSLLGSPPPPPAPPAPQIAHAANQWGPSIGRLYWRWGRGGPLVGGPGPIYSPPNPPGAPQKAGPNPCTVQSEVAMGQRAQRQLRATGRSTRGSLPMGQPHSAQRS